MKRKRMVLCVSSFAAQLSICMINFALIYYLRGKYNLSPSLIGIASSIYTVSYFISCIALSSLSSTLKRLEKAFIAFFGMALSNLVLIIVNSIFLTFLMLALYGCAMSFLWPNIESWITEKEDGRDLAIATNSFNFSWSLGAGLSTMIVGLLSSLSPSLPIAFSCLLFITIFFLLFITSYKEGDEKLENGSDIVTGKETALRYFSWCGNFLNYTCYSLIMNIFPLYALEHLSFDERTSGFLLLFRGLSSCISFLVFSRFRFWQFNHRVVLFSQLSLSLLFLAFIHLTSFSSLVVFFTIFGFFFSLLYEMSIFHGSSGAEDKEKRMIVHEVLLNIGMVAGATAGGIIYQMVSFSAILYILSAVAFSFFLLELLISAILSSKGIKL